jgi:macrolide transport system ATP-binding/permease protein
MIQIENITKTFGTGKVGVRALHDVSLKIRAGEFIAIIGPSGSGKSTLLHILGFLDRPDSGSYYLEEKEITKLTDDELAILRNRLVGFVFQQFHLLPRVSAVENAELPLIYAGKRHLKEKAREKIEEVGLAQRAAHQPNELSGGEQQRVAIARSLVNEPLIILADEPTGNLDTKSEEEIISILEKLNQKGKTIIMVTHEREIAQHAKRIIRMRDGEIISDERVGTESPGFSPAAADISLKDILSQTHLSTGTAEFIDHLRQALGSNLLMVRPGSRQMHGAALAAGAVTRFTLQDAEAIGKLAEVKEVSPSVRGRAQLVYGNKNWNTQVQGTGANYAVMRASVPTSGRFFTEEELRVRQKVVLLGATVARELFGDVNPIGATVKINRINFQAIGVLPEKGTSHWYDRDDLVIIPVTTAMYRLLGKQYIDYIDVEVKDPGLMEEAQSSIRGLIIKRHRLNKDNEHSFQIRNMAEIQETIESTTKTMTWLLGSIAAISLLVGGIGIMNIMLVSVTERTREIGLRKAVGARRIDIMTQFLIEAVVLTFMGGIAGIVFGSGIAWLLGVFAGWPTKVPGFSIILATTFSIAVGIGFGLWPARQAAKLNPIEALRYE